MIHALEIVGLVAVGIIGGVIVGHYIQDKFFGDKGWTGEVTQAQIEAWAATAAGHNYFQRLLCGFDMYVNVIFGGMLDETISSRTSRWVRSKNPEFIVWRACATWIIWLCDLVQAMHGVKAESGDMIRALNALNKELADLGLPVIRISQLLPKAA